MSPRGMMIVSYDLYDVVSLLTTLVPKTANMTLTKTINVSSSQMTVTFTCSYEIEGAGLVM